MQRCLTFGMAKKQKPRIAIIGAGIAGVTLARALHAHAQVTLFEKSRGVGGRMATRRAGDFNFDHGAQFFTARGRPFRTFLAPLIAAGIVAEWAGCVVKLAPGQPPTDLLWFEPHYVAQPGMNSLCKALATDLTIAIETEIAPLAADTSGPWHPQASNGRDLGLFDWVISTAPPVQTRRLFGDHLPETSPLTGVTLHGCYALMLGFTTPQPLPWIGAKVENSPLGWISVNSTKPCRATDQTTLVAHSRNDWAEEHIEADPAIVQKQLLAALHEVTNLAGADTAYTALHRWRYALVAAPDHPGVYLDPTQKLAAVSDWSMSSRIEESWLAANDLAEKLKGVIG